MVSKREIIIWISVFATFLAVLASVAMVVQLINEGSGFIVRPYLIGDLLNSVFGDLSVDVYLGISIIITFLLLGVTCLFAFGKQPPDPEILEMLSNVEGDLAALSKTQEATTTEMTEQLDYNRKTNRKFFNEINSNLEEANKETLALLGSHGRAIKKSSRDLGALIENKANETGEKLSADLKKQGAVVRRVRRLSEANATALNMQKAELEEIKLGLEKIEGKIVPIQAKLKSRDNPEEIKGIGPALGKELKELGVTSVGEFITTDPAVIGEKTRLSQEMAENFQATAQLMMVPGVDDGDAELLIEAGIKSRKELANQDLIQLSSKVGKIAKTYVDQGKISKDEYPTIEEICSWIRMAA